VSYPQDSIPVSHGTTTHGVQVPCCAGQTEPTCILFYFLMKRASPRCPSRSRVRRWPPQSILPQQRLLEDEGAWDAVLKYVPSESVRERIVSRWRSSRGHGSDVDVNLQRWHDLEAACEKARCVRFATASLLVP
jgi:hypothetical protein